MLQRALFTAVFSDTTDAALPLDEERELITAAQAGDPDATERLIYAYAPALRGGLKWYTRTLITTPQRSDIEDVQQNAVIGFLEALRAFDLTKHDRLAATAPSYIRNSVAASAGLATGFTVPERTLKRFFGILRAAEGDARRAAEIAPDHEMKRETFLSVLDAVRNVSSLDNAQRSGAEGDGDSGAWTGEGTGPIWDGSVADAEDRILVEIALASVDEAERDVVGLAYGFTDYDPVPDAEIGHRLGLSRPKVQRVRSGALSKMRSALGVA